MADSGYSGWWVLGALGLGTVIGVKMLPAYKRIKETDELLDIAEEVAGLAAEDGDEELIAQSALIMLQIKRYRKGLIEDREKTDTKENASMIGKLKDNLAGIKNRLTFWSKNGKSEDQETKETPAEEAAA